MIDSNRVKDFLFKVLPGIANELLTRRIRNRARGYLPTLICVVERASDHQFALVHPVDGPNELWMFPQEGIHFNETLHQAAFRALKEECGIESGADVREVTYVCDRKLAAGRVHRKPGVLKLVGKSYYAARLLVPAGTEISPTQGDVDAARWFSGEELWSKLKGNEPDKLAIYDLMFKNLLPSSLPPPPKSNGISDPCE